MNDQKGPIVIGRLGKPHGLKGEIRVNADKEEYLDFLEVGGYLLIKELPYRIESLRDIGGIVITLQNLKDRNTLEGYKGLPISLPYSLELADLQEEPDALEEWIGFVIFDETSQRHLGPIITVQEMATQILARLEIEGKDVFIPLHEDLILDVDPLEKTITMRLPEGLLDLYI